MTFTIWVDADAAPRDVKDVVFRAARRTSVPAVLVANQRMPTPLDNPFVSTVWVQGGPDVADQHIADSAVAGDIAITADIPLAAILVEKGLVVLDPRGERYTEDNVRERLSIRDFMESLRGSGVETGGSKPYGPRDKQAFAGALDRALAAAQRRS
ncbi:MAG TPA: YaiI/YqxD family protein [Longimicrobiales bacterium]|nr:YaiI/YqxD family protein [Longimicrobiales bacterium]